MVGRGRRRLPVGPRRAGHEVPDRGRGGRRRARSRAPAGAPRAATLKLISVVDEETGGAAGAQWLTENRPDLARCDWLLNEGAGAVMPFGDRRLYGVCVAEKGTFRFAVRARGTRRPRVGPGLADNALLKLAPLLARLGRAAARPTTSPTSRARLLEALGVDADDPARRARAAAPRSTRGSRRSSSRRSA